ncbi:MAG: MmgE/PrpD family protein [Parvibaculaceae bacterium]|nr:MmgE/PrpD family protein [Parvibaculaceae bacterium]
MAEDIEHSEPVTMELARRIVAGRDAAPDAAAVTVAKQCILDWFGVTLAGLEEPVARLLREEIAGHSTGEATIVGSTGKCAPADAALINGAASHALDYDDVHPLVGHPTVAILPAVLAIAEAEQASGEKVLRAFIAGYEAAAFIGSLAMPSHYDRGFHSTATLGSFGAAAAAGLLLDLDEGEMAMALGLAGTQAAGLKSMFGTMAKPFHAGKAASNGVLAARLARRGFTAHPDVLGVPQGFIATQSDRRTMPETPPEFPGNRVADTLFKFHAACYLTHSSIEAVGGLCRDGALLPDDIASIDIHVAPGHLKVCNIPAPHTGLEVKFSLAHVAALAASGIDTAAPESYSDKIALDPALVAIRNRTTIHGDRRAGTGADILIKTRSGGSFTAETDVGIPDRNLERQGERLLRKFRSLTGPVIGPERAERLRQRIESLESADNIHSMMKLE